MPYIRSADAALYFEEYGAGETLILLPGLFGTIELDWRRFIPDFSRRFHTIAVDLRGHGRTNNPSGVLTAPLLIQDLEVMFETLEIDRAFLCSHGRMAFLPLAFGAAHPDRVFGIILHAPILTTGDLSPDAGSIGPIPMGTFPAPLEYAHGAENWKNLVACRNGFLTSIPNGTFLRDLPFPVLVTTDRDPGQTLLPDLQLCTVMPIPRSGPLITDVPRSPFVAAVQGFASRATASFPGQNRTQK